MSDAEFLAYAGSLAAAGLVFLILAVLGLGQGLVLRVLDVLLGLAFLGYAAYLMVVAPDDPFITWLVFVTPLAGLVVALTARRRARARLRRLEEEHANKPYAGQDPPVNAERLPYPSPPPPLDPSAPSRKPSEPAAPSAGMPSGLPDVPPSGLGANPVEAAPRPPRPSGLPQVHAEPSPAPDPAPATGVPTYGWSASASSTPAPTSHPSSTPAPTTHPSSTPAPTTHPSSTPAPTSHGSPPHGWSTPASPSHRAPSHASSTPASPSHASSHAEPGYRARHGAADDEVAQHDYTGGRHRADQES